MADSVLGQPGFLSNTPNQPAGTPSDSNLAFAFAAGVAVGPDGRLYLADDANNRVLSWPSATSFSIGEPADLVFGQPDFTSSDPNQGGLSASSLSLPQGVAVDGEGRLWVTDAFNHRVLRFDDPVHTDRVADLVIGQPDFTSNDQNLGLGESAASADSLNFPGRVLVRGSDLFVSDSGNSRVLHYSLPVGNQPSADRVFGQLDDLTAPFKNNDGSGTCQNTGEDPCGPPSARNLFNPIGLALNKDGALYVSDWINHRVLRFDRPLSSDTVADAVYGQPDFVSGDPNHGGLTAGLSLPVDVAVDAFNQLLVADSLNHRVLVYADPRQSGALPTAVFGQLGMLTGGSTNHGLGSSSTDAEGLFGPTGLAVDGEFHVYVVDANNGRALRFDDPIRPSIPGDSSDDGDVDLSDFQQLRTCLEGPTVGPPSAPCRPSDVEDDLDVDLRDFWLFAGCLSGEAIPGDPHCYSP